MMTFSMEPTGETGKVITIVLVLRCWRCFVFHASDDSNDVLKGVRFINQCWKQVQAMVLFDSGAERRIESFHAPYHQSRP